MHVRDPIAAVESEYEVHEELATQAELYERTLTHMQQHADPGRQAQRGDGWLAGCNFPNFPLQWILGALTKGIFVVLAKYIARYAKGGLLGRPRNSPTKAD